MSVATRVDSVTHFPDNVWCIGINDHHYLTGKTFMAGATLVFTDGNFKAEVLDSPGVALVDFWAPWCGPCVRLGPTIDELATDFAGKAKVGKLNVDENSKVASSYGITSIPCMIVFKDGQPSEKVVGLVKKDLLAAAINKAIGG
jgi:thioredoxin 1